MSSTTPIRIQQVTVKCADCNKKTRRVLGCLEPTLCGECESTKHLGVLSANCENCRTPTTRYFLLETGGRLPVCAQCKKQVIGKRKHIKDRVRRKGYTKAIGYSTYVDLYISQNKTDYITTLPVKLSSPNRSENASVDRIRSDIKHYGKENIVLTSVMTNTAKGPSTNLEFIRWIKALLAAPGLCKHLDKLEEQELQLEKLREEELKNATEHRPITITSNFEEHNPTPIGN